MRVGQHRRDSDGGDQKALLQAELTRGLPCGLGDDEQRLPQVLLNLVGTPSSSRWGGTDQIPPEGHTTGGLEGKLDG
jgi:hypothetical protein